VSDSAARRLSKSEHEARRSHGPAEARYAPGREAGSGRL